MGSVDAIQPSGSAARAIAALLTTARSGPLTASQLARKMNMSRTAVHRAVHTLMDHGLMRYQLGSRRLVVSVDVLNGNAEGEEHLPQGFSDLAKRCQSIIDEKDVQLDLACLKQDATALVVESSVLNKTYYEDVLDNDLATIIFANLEAANRESTLRSIMEETGGRDLNWGLANYFKLAKEQKFLFDEKTASFCISIKTREGNVFGIRILVQPCDDANWIMNSRDMVLEILQVLTAEPVQEEFSRISA